MVVLDLLLLVAALLFLLPLNPVFSSLPAVVWVMAQLALAPAERRWAAWPLLFVLLLYSRSWWLNQMPHPVSAQDGLLLVAALLAAACVSPQRWQLLPRKRRYNAENRTLAQLDLENPTILTVTYLVASLAYLPQS